MDNLGGWEPTTAFIIIPRLTDTVNNNSAIKIGSLLATDKEYIRFLIGVIFPCLHEADKNYPDEYTAETPQ